MIQQRLARPIRVLVDARSKDTYLMVTVDQLPWVRERLDRNAIGYWVESAAVSVNGQPAIVVINFIGSCDPVQIQAPRDQTD